MCSTMCFVVVLSFWFVSNDVTEIIVLSYFVRERQESRTNDCTRASRDYVSALHVIEFSCHADALRLRVERGSSIMF